MKNVKKLSIDLSSVDDEVQSKSNQDEHKTIYNLPEDQGKLEGAFFSTSNDIVLYRGDYEFNAEVIGDEYFFGNAKAKFAEETLMINSTVGGWHKQVNQLKKISADDQQEIVSFGQEYTNFAIVTEFDQDNIFQSSRKVVNAVLTIPLTSLRLLLGSETTDKLRKFLEIEEPQSFKTHKIPSRITKILHAAINPHLTGAAKQLYCQAKAHEYLCELVELMEKMETETSSFDEEATLILDMHDMLLHHEGKLPTMAELAEQYNVPARRLNTQFQKEYGLTINQYVTKMRLHQAHDLVASEDVALKIIASQIGYSHVNHFITAFKREFGYSPGALRKK